MLFGVDAVALAEFFALLVDGHNIGLVVEDERLINLVRRHIHAAQPQQIPFRRQHDQQQRQHLCQQQREPDTRRPQPKPVNQQQDQHDGQQEIIQHRKSPVSYTHLDVYKRQAPHPPRGRI